MADQNFTPETISENRFPDPTVLLPTSSNSTGAPSSKDFGSPPDFPDMPIPVPVVASHVISDSLDTGSKKIKLPFQFSQLGAIQVGQILISPVGILGQTLAAETTFFLDAETGDATFKGTISAGSVITATIAANQITGQLVNAQIASIEYAKITNVSVTNAQIVSLSASKLTAGTINAAVITVQNLNADNITAGTLNGRPINNSTIAGSSTWNGTPIDNAYIGNLSANKITSGTINANVVSVINLNASNITTGVLTADRIQGGTLSIGGNVDSLGIISVKNSSGTEISRLNNNGIILRNTRGVFFEQTNAGNYGSIECNSSNQLVVHLPSGNVFRVVSFDGLTNYFTLSSNQAFSQYPFVIGADLYFGTSISNRVRHDIQGVGQINATGGDLILDGGGNRVRLNSHLYTNGRSIETSGAELYINLGGNKLKLSDNINMNDKTIDACDTVWAYHFNNRSDRNLKKFIKPIDGLLEKTMQFSIKQFQFKKGKNDDRVHIGFIAQEVEEIMPELVYTDDQGIMGINTHEMVAVLTGALQELGTEVKHLKSLVVPLEA